MTSSAKIVEQIRKALADPESLEYEKLKTVAQEYGKACARLNLAMTKAVVYYSTGNYREAARVAKEGNLLEEYQTLLFPEVKTWRKICRELGWDCAEVSTVNGEKLKKFLMTQRPNVGLSVQKPRLFVPRDAAFFTDSTIPSNDHSAMNGRYDANESAPRPYMRPSHKKSGMIWVLIGFLAGFVILAIVVIALLLTVGGKKDGDSAVPPSELATFPQPSSDKNEKKADEENPADGSKNRGDENPASQVNVTEITESSDHAMDGGEDKVEQTSGDEVDAKVAKEESAQTSTNPNVVKLENQWKQLKERSNFEQTVLFVDERRKEVGRLYKILNDRISSCKTFFKSYEERNSEEIESVSKLCDQITNTQSDAEYLANHFDFEFFLMTFEFVIEGMDQIKTLYDGAWSDEDLEHRASALKGMNDILIMKHFAEAKSKNSGDKTDNAKKDEEIENLADQLKSIRDKLDAIYQQSKNELSTDLSDIKSKVSEFANMRLNLEKDILTYVVQTVDSKNIFSVFTNDVSSPFKADIDGKKRIAYTWHVFDCGKDEEADFYKGMKAYVDYCMNSENKWTCNLTFTFYKTKEIDAQTKTIEFSPNNKDEEYFSIDDLGEDEEVTPVFLGVKGKVENFYKGRIVFYISDPECIPAILRSVRVRLSFTSTVNPEEESISSSFCQLHKPIDMSEVSNDIELEHFLSNCEFISETELGQLSNNPKSENKDGSSSDKVFCVVVCDKEGKTTNELGTFSLRVNLIESPTKNVDAEGETGEKESGNETEKKILLQFSRTAERSDGNEKDVTFTYKQEFVHKLLKELKKSSFSAGYTREWSSLNEKATSTDPDVDVDDAFKEETINWWQTEYGTGNLLFYFVRAGEETHRENWILYGQAPYSVSE